jgi:uncharacterized protein YigA (DUF484 family)
MHECARCSGSVGDAYRFCPWCAAPQRLKLVEFFLSAHFEEPDKLFRVSRYLHDDLEERHVRFSIWHDARVDAAVSLEDDEAERLGRFLLDTSQPPRSSLRDLLDRVAAIRY